MQESQDFQAVFRENLGTIERLVSSLCRRHRLDGDEAEEFASWVHLKLLENDCAVFRKFRGESAMATYLTVVLAMLFRDYRVEHWGRWRPSAVARRMGKLAVRLEYLVYCQEFRLEQAGEVLRSAGGPDLTDRELAQMLAQIPPRGQPRPVLVDEAALAGTAAAGGADEPLERAEADDERRQARHALFEAMERLDPEDRLLVRLRFWEEMSVADIARSLNLAQKPLYRRIERALGQLRRELESAGVSRERVRSILGAWAA
jgi:RNA polymerase sigma factor (sigma-70 family)